jgi:hypothetical protein
MAEEIQNSNQQEKLSFFDYVMEVIGWLQIFFSPFLGSIIAGGIFYLWIRGVAGLITGSVIVVSGMVVGVIVANRVWKKRGTINFMSRVNASPELNALEPASDPEKITSQL